MYLNMLVKHQLVELSMKKADVLDLEAMSRFGGRTLFPVEYFREREVAYGEMRNLAIEDMAFYQSPWEAFQGTDLITDEDCVGILCGGERLWFTVNENAYLQKERFAPEETIHIYADISIKAQLPRAELIVSDEFNRIVTSYQSCSVRREALQQFLGLKEMERHVLKRFLLDSEYGAALFNVLCYAAFQMLDRNTSMEAALKEWSSGEYAEDVRTLLGIQDLRHAFRLDLGGDSEMGAHFRRPWVDYLAMHHAFRQGERAEALLSRWERCVPDLAAALSRFSDVGEMRDLVADMINVCQQTGETQDEADEFLFHLLLIDSPLDDNSLVSILEVLFADRIDSAKLRAIASLKKSPHILKIRDFIMQEFRKSFKAGVPRYTWVMAAIWFHDRDQLGENPVELAQRELLSTPFSQGTILSLAALSLTAWSRRVGGGLPLWEYKLDRFTGLERVLYQLLSDPKPQYFRWAVSLFYDYVLNSYMGRTLLEKQGVVRGCFKALADSRLKESAETLLSLFPGRVITDGITYEMQKEYLSRLQDAYVIGNDDLMKLFRICFNIGAFPDEYTTLTQFQRLVAALAKVELDFNQEDRLHPDAYYLLRLFCQETLNTEALTQTSEEALEALECVPDDSLYEAYRKVYEQLENDENAVFVLASDVVEMSRFISACRAVDNEFVDYADREAMLRTLAERSQIQATNLGSCVVSLWFKMLCRFGLAHQAFAFYKANSEILNRPYLFYSTAANHNGEKRCLFSDWHRFLNSPERVVEAVAFAESLGHHDVVQTFKTAAEIGCLPKNIAERILTKPTLMWELDELDKKLLACTQWEHSFPRKAGKAFAAYYDDQGIIGKLRKEGTETEVKALADFGYKNRK